MNKASSIKRNGINFTVFLVTKFRVLIGYRALPVLRRMNAKFALRRIITKFDRLWYNLVIIGNSFLTVLFSNSMDILGDRLDPLKTNLLL